MFCISPKITLFPYSIGTIELDALLIFLLKAYVTPPIGTKVKLARLTDFLLVEKSIT